MDEQKQVEIKPAVVDGKPVMQINVTEKQARQIAKRQQQRRKANPKMFLDGESRVLMFDEPPEVLMSQEAMNALFALAKPQGGKYKVRLLAVEVLDGKANIHFGKMES